MVNMYKFGFKIGARLVAIETMVGQVEKVNKTIRDTKREKTVKDYTANRTSMLRRIHEYSAQIKKLDGYNEEVESVIKNILC
jgi:predicted secreted protein